MNKPISIAIAETNQKLAEVLNSSGLPASILRLLLNDAAQAVASEATKELKNDYARYKAEVDNGKEHKDGAE